MATPTEWLNEFQVNTGTAATGTQSNAKIIGLNNGHFVVAWIEGSTGLIGTGAGSDIVAKIFDAEGNVVQDSFQLNTLVIDNENDFDLAATHDGFVITFYDANDIGNAASEPQIRVQRFDFDGGLLSTFTVATEVPGDAVDNPQIAANLISTNDDILTAWEEGTDVFGRVIDQAGVLGTEFNAAQNSVDTDTLGDVAVLSNGNFVTVYQETDTIVGIEFKIVTPAGTQVANINVSDAGTGGVTAFDPRVSALEGGGFVVTWTEGGDILARAYSNTGASLFSEITVAGGTNSQNESVVVGLPDGDFVVAWDDDTSGNLFARRFNADGTGDGSTFTVENAGTTDIDIDVTGDGRILFTWTAGNGTGEIFASIWDPRDTTIDPDDYDGARSHVLDSDVITTGLAGSDVVAGIGVKTVLGQGGNDTITSNGQGEYFGGGGNDSINAGLGSSETLDGGVGNDTLNTTSFSGNYNVNMTTGETNFSTIGTGESFVNFENLITGSGNDTITDTFASNFIDSGAGNDSINGTFGFDTIVTGLGDDTVVQGGSAADVIDLGDGDDVMSSGGSGGDNVTAGAGNDNVNAGDGNNTVSLGDGNDTAVTGTGADTITGEGGNDDIDSGAGDDSVSGGLGSDTIVTGDGNDTVTGGADADTLITGAGDDSVNGGEGNDDIDAGDGNDDIDAGNGNDTIDGGFGDDTIVAGAGNDLVNQVDAGGADLVLGGDGNDTITSSGEDTVLGGNGQDLIFAGIGTLEQLDGGAGLDTINTTLWSFDYELDLATGLTNYAGELFTNFENIVFGIGNDEGFGTAGTNAMSGNAGNDRLLGLGGNDTLVGGAGMDTLNGGDGDDSILGGADADSVYAEAGDDFVDGGDGSDLLEGKVGNDTLIGGLGDDTLRASDGNDFVNGGDGNDVAFGGNDNDTMFGGNGNDTLDGSSGNDSIDGEGGDDVLVGETGQDTLFGDTGNDTMRGGGGDDFLDGWIGNDVLFGSSGNDTLYGFNGDDLLEGNQQNDQLFGEAGNDTLRGGDGFDSLFGGVGNDTLAGGNGNDLLIGGEGVDILRGNAQNDTFVFQAVSESAFGAGDLIDGIDGAGVAGGDVIDLAAIDANTLIAGDQAFNFIGQSTAAAGLGAGAGTLWTQNVGGQTWLRGSVDGDAIIDLEIRIADGAVVAGDYVLGDFIL